MPVFAIEVLAADDVKAATSETVKVFVRDSEVKIDESSMQSKQVHFGSAKATDTTFDGSNKDGPQNFEMTWSRLPIDGAFLGGTREGDRANKAKFDGVIGSLDPVR